jgi:hypothetical protein
MPNLDCNSDCARAKIVLKLRALGCEAKILVEISVRRRGVREYSVERARRMSFLARVEVVLFVLEFVSESVLDAGDDEEERRRCRGGDSFVSSGEGSRC